MKAALKKKWIAALRSGKYKQGEGQLYNRSTRAYCCIGVLGRCAGIRFDGERGLLPGHDDTLDLRLVRQGDLARKNDSGKWSFKRIATWIEKNL